MKKHNALRSLRIIGILEGISYLVLLFVSMPLKYIFHLPQPVLINGWIHGVLFVLFAIAVIRVWTLNRWPFKKAFTAAMASIIPFGTFWFDKKLKEEQRGIEQG